jgi:hypothetical protein
MIATLILLASVALTAVTVALLAIANWPHGATPRRPLGKTMELAPFERL